MDLIALLILFIGAVLLAVGANTGNRPCSSIGAVLLAIGFGIQLFARTVS
jgi:hypothetical protein